MIGADASSKKSDKTGDANPCMHVSVSLYGLRKGRHVDVENERERTTIEDPILGATANVSEPAIASDP